MEGGYAPFYNPGGPGSTPFPGETYTQPGPRDLEPVIIALDDPMRVSYSARPAPREISTITYNILNLPVLPEGIEYDPTREAFLISSALGGAINMVRTDGTFSNLIPQGVFNGNGTFGLQIDTLNDRLLAVGDNIQDPTAAWLFRFELASGTLIDSIDLAAVPTGPGALLNYVNDVAVDAEGNAYVTNSDKGVIYKVDTSGAASVFFQDNTLAPSNPATLNGFNGIEYHPNGYLLVVHSENDKIYKIMLNNPSQATEVSLPAGFLRSGDGMFLDDDELVVISNAANAAATPDPSDPRVPFVAKFRSSDDWNLALLEGDTYATGDVFPTTVVKVEGDYFINYAYFNYLAYQSNPVNFIISKASFDAEQRYVGSSTEIPRVNTPVVPFSYGAAYPEPYYSGCTTPLAEGVPDLSGEWVETTVSINGAAITPQPNPRRERIEQCGNRILIASNGVLHEVFVADSTMFNGVNDVDPNGFPAHFAGNFEGDVFLLSPFVTDTNQVVQAITRELIQDDAGNPVLKLSNPNVGTIRYLLAEGTTSVEKLTQTQQVNVAPNPFRDQTLVTWHNPTHEIYQAQLLSLTGQVVRRYPDLRGESLLMKREGLAPGLYFLRLTSKVGQVKNVKLLIRE